MKKIQRTERGWAGHFCGAKNCLFRRNTLLQCEDQSVVVTTIGSWRPIDEILEVGPGRYYETMVFMAKNYKEADVSKQIYNFTSPWFLKDKCADDKANDMHETVVEEISQMMIDNTIHHCLIMEE